MQADGVFLQAACTLSIDEKEKHRGQCGAELGGSDSMGFSNRRRCERRKSDRREGVRTPSLSLFRYQLVDVSTDVDDADAWFFGEGAAETGDEDLETAGVEEVVVAPQVEEKVLHGYDFSVGTAEAAEDFGFAVGEVGAISFREVFKRLE